MTQSQIKNYEVYSKIILDTTLYIHIVMYQEEDFKKVSYTADVQQITLLMVSIKSGNWFVRYLLTDKLTT